MSQIWKRLFNKNVRVTPDDVPAAPPPSPEIADETKAVQVDFIQKLLALERKNNRLLDATAAVALMNVNGVQR